MNQLKKKENINKLTKIQFHVTQENGTERPYENEFWTNHKKGIYVDIVSKEPLFSSIDKFDSSCGWPSFSKPIQEIKKKLDVSHGMRRIEVRSLEGDSHLGHLFDDGPEELGGMRYCINSASLEFIPYEEMIEKGYAEFIQLFEGERHV